MNSVLISVLLIFVRDSCGKFWNCHIAENVCPNKDINFFFTNRTVHLLELNVTDPSSIKNTITDPALKTKIIFHGYNSSANETDVAQIIDAFLLNGNYNIIAVDWSPLVGFACYITGVISVSVVGRCTAELIDLLVEEVGIKLADIHLIGFSIGAHCAGTTGDYYKAGKLPHITGLDPAKPLFITPIIPPQLCATDAEFVDVIHTDAGIAGEIFDDGTVDFWMNDGKSQPHCKNISLSLEYFSCDHKMAIAYYAESINANPKYGFYGIKCDKFENYEKCKSENPDRNIFGPNTPKNTTGRYFVRTAANPPYGIGLDLK